MVGGVAEKMKINKLRKNVKALSPIFAVLILIAIAVIAGIIVYMFTSGTLASMLGGGSAAQEKAAIQGVTVNTATTITVYAQYVDGGTQILINGAIIKDADGTTILGTCSVPLTVDGALVSVPVTLASALDPTHTYTVTLTSANGGSFVSSSFSG